MTQTIYIGTSGWSYPHWKGPFYPADLPERERLDFYTRHFNSVEINSSFYSLPPAETLARWRDGVPGGFVFTAKASRYITHIKKLKDGAGTLPKLLNRLETLAEHLGPVLFQLPPNWHFNEARLIDFLGALDAGHRYAFEFRDPSWLNDRTYELLERHNAALCVYDIGGRASPAAATADFVYIRLHGPSREPYRGRYHPQTLAKWARCIRAWRAENKTVYCYFDNDEYGYAARNAAQLAAKV